MKRLIVTDIFGRTKALEQLAAELAGNVEIIDPYNSKDMGFKNEAEAYAYFTAEVGLELYSKQLFNRLKVISDPVSLIGFSVGASAIWLISHYNQFQVRAAQCFYGSQIRHHTNITPVFPIQMILPATEENFSISQLMTALGRKQNVEINHVSYLHGFMNRHSENFNEAGYLKFIHILE